MWSDSELGKRGPGASVARGALGLEDLSDLIGSIYDCALDPSKWNATVADISERFEFASAMFAVLRFRGFVSEFKVHYGFDAEWLEKGDEYMEESVALWGGAARMHNHPIDEPMLGTDVTPLAEWKRSRYYRDILGPRGLIDTVALALARQPDLLGYLALNRNVAKGPISLADIEGVRLIAPHLRRAVTIGNLFDLKAVELATVHSVLNGLASAVILVEEDLRIVHVNTVGETMLASGAVLSAVQGHLSVRGRFGQDALRAAVTAAARNETTLGQRGIGIPATADDGATAVLHLLPLTRGEVRAGLSPRAVAAVFAVADGAHAPVDGIAALYDLTPAEALIFASLVQGASLEEIAAGLGIAKSTARTHLLHIFGKTGCSRQAELVALASRLSPRL